VVTTAMKNRPSKRGSRLLDAAKKTSGDIALL
jgi:hypothetical protein